MEQEIIKFRLKGHESFYIREGWLRKGIKNIEQNHRIFGDEFATDKLGVGSNMVKSIRYWLRACGLTKEQIAKGTSGKREQVLTEDFGKSINLYDPYFEDIFTLWLIHYKISINAEICTTWYLFFNDFKVNEFNKNDLFEVIKISLNKFVKNKKYSENSLKDDCNCIIKTYCLDKKEEKNPEENNICPLTELGLIEKIKLQNGREFYIKKKPSVDKLDKLVILYIILDNLKKSKSISIDKILNDDCNAGKTLNLDRNMLNIYLDELKYDDYIEINRAAGLDTIYIKKEITKEKVIETYFEEV